MKSKILSHLFLFTSLSIIYVTMSSEDTGYYSNGTSCGGGSCHGLAVNTATSVAITGLPTTLVTGQTYPLTLTVTHATNVLAGFNISSNIGTFIAGSGSKINGSAAQITHTTPKSAVSGVTSFSFSWKAPSTPGTVTFNGVGNSVNGINNADAGDHWNTTTETRPVSFPSSINENDKLTITCYPNPANDYIIAQGIGMQAKNIKLYNLFGQSISSPYSFNDNDCKINCSNIAKGMYILSANVNGKIRKTTFTKN